MKTKIKSALTRAALALAALSTFNLQLSTAHAQGTAFTYQGRLNDGANPANGNYDLRFAIYDAAGGGAQQGNPLTNSATGVSNGLFTVTLDFGNQFPGAARWLEIAVRTNGAAGFFTLNPRQPLTPTPYAITAENLNGTVVGSGLSGTYGNAVTLNNVGNQFSGSYAGDGEGLTNLNAASISWGTLADTRLSGNVALLNGNQTFTGQNTFNNSFTIAGDPQVGTGSSDYHHLQIGGGNSWGFLYGSYWGLGDGIHMGYNWYADASGTPQIIHPDGATSRISTGYGSIELATGGIGQPPTDRLVVNSFGLVGIGTVNPNYLLDVNGSVNVGSYLQVGYSGISDNGSLTVQANVFTYGSTLTLWNGNGYKPGGGSWASTSDEHLKKNIRPLTGALDKLTQLRGVTFEWINPEDHANQTNAQSGFIAQEVERVFPDWVSQVAAGEHDKSLTSDGKVHTLTLPFAYDALVVEAIKELRQEKNVELQEVNHRLEAQRAENAELKQRLEALEQIIRNQKPN